MTPTVPPKHAENNQGQGSTTSDHKLPAAPEEIEQENKATAPSKIAHNPWNPQHFKTLMTLAKGTYATVQLVESSNTKQLYVIKARNKSLIYANSEIKFINTEKEILLLAKKEKHPFIAEVFGGFQTQSQILLYLEFCQGGSLKHYVSIGPRFDLERTRFYTAEVCMGLRWIHGMGMIHRALSLGHILLGLDGHIKLVDFVVSKAGLEPRSKTKTFCGQAEFMAPEMPLDQGYDSAIDWWQLGIITYQMLTRTSPFQGDNENDVYDSILSDEPSFPDYMTKEPINFVQRLLEKEPGKRLGSGLNGADQIMAHAFFHGTNWEDLYHRRVPAPFVPKVANRTDASHFDSEYTLLNTQVDMDKPGALNPELQELFRGFEFSTE